MSSSQCDVGEMLTKGCNTEKALNGQMLLVILQTLQFLGRQGLPCRGHVDEESNFVQALKLRGNRTVTVVSAVLFMTRLQTNMPVRWVIHTCSPHCSGVFKDIKCEIFPDTMGFQVLCPTRWGVRSETFHSILENYTPSLEIWEIMLEGHLDSNTRARVSMIMMRLMN